MAHVYAEQRQQALPGEQTRWVCGECHREWLHARESFGNVGKPWDEQNCPVCGSQQLSRVTFKGIFDRETPAEELARLLTVTTDDQLLQEAERRATRPAIHEGSAPPVPLGLEPDPDLVGVAPSGSHPPLTGRPSRSFAPEFD